MTTTETNFLRTMAQACIAWESTSPVEPSVKRTISVLTIVQAILETGWGKSSLCAPNVNNYGGVKHHLPQWPGISEQTREVIQGQNQIIKDAFQCYPSIADYIADHAIILIRWQCVSTALQEGVEAVCGALGPWTDLDRQKMEMKPPQDPDHSNYSTDGTYPSTLMTLINQTGLTDPTQLDRYAALPA